MGFSKTSTSTKICKVTKDVRSMKDVLLENFGFTVQTGKMFGETRVSPQNEIKSKCTSKTNEIALF